MVLSFTFAAFTLPEVAVGVSKHHHDVRLVQALIQVYNEPILVANLHEMLFGRYAVKGCVLNCWMSPKLG